jgi:hypothetical protein
MVKVSLGAAAGGVCAVAGKANAALAVRRIESAIVFMCLPLNFVADFTLLAAFRHD